MSQEMVHVEDLLVSQKAPESVDRQCNRWCPG